MSLTSKVLLATTNQGKIKEFLELLADLGTQVLTLNDLGIVIDVNETGHTYADNAALKAKAYCIQTGIPALADDSGLEVNALSGAPGIYSARFLPKVGATDADRRKYLLEQLTPYQRPWTARFCCVVAIAEPTGLLHFTEGACEGQIIPQERGHGGFGYDPVFLVEGRNQTMAELPSIEKNQISHRALAIHAALPLLKTILSK